MLDRKVTMDLKKAFPFVAELGDKQENFFNSLYHQRLESVMILLDESRGCSGVILVLSGVIRIYKLSEDGKEITLYRIGRGETCVLTVACMLGTGDIPFPVAAAAEQVSDVVFIPIEIFKILYETPSIQKFFFHPCPQNFILYWDFLKRYL